LGIVISFAPRTWRLNQFYLQHSCFWIYSNQWKRKPFIGIYTGAFFDGVCSIYLVGFFTTPKVGICLFTHLCHFCFFLQLDREIIKTFGGLRPGDRKHWGAALSQLYWLSQNQGCDFLIAILLYFRAIVDHHLWSLTNPAILLFWRFLGIFFHLTSMLPTNLTADRKDHFSQNLSCFAKIFWCLFGDYEAWLISLKSISDFGIFGFYEIYRFLYALLLSSQIFFLRFRKTKRNSKFQGEK